ncbi:helix-turn-helix domain-containing protein [Burkholderia cepacia]|uniref:XRE family transcriptional regulator n=1 Tax=Burkholderia cepacia TaxID=292 RepID=A0AAX2RHP8_BURCE|nr:helix-turn-helix transcriptional regulator [Burkholderia cepacia]TES99678.1 XRE family transcriptional regulator [Burkholderia cepacia]TEU41671.1 XRE family transcriptional regulator [Burkholderia cepacia]TEU48700.1 XRE family transcriptional regulator [Burkholderia cepacia]TEU95412.1 XRE family transcriptional regulator [Burkholderia cepacia]TEV04806.1 XRE family transcriptional regulator [Burkholderia cepacia]
MNSQANSAFAATLRKLRNERGMSQYTLAKVTDLDRTYISLLERGLRSPSLDTMLALAKGLNVSLVEMAAAVESALLAS